MLLDDARKKINALDAELVRLLDGRARLGREIGAIKAREHLPAHQPEREHLVLASLAALSDGGMPAGSLETIFRAIMRETRALQEGGAESRPAPACGGHAAGDGKRDAEAEIAENTEAAPGFFRMRLRCPALAGAFRPGQFFQMRIGPAGEGCFLRRPFAPSEYAPDGFAFVYAVAGKGTERMAALPPGARVRVLAPLGNGYSVPEGMASALLIGGGCGAPSLAPLAARLRERGVRTTAVLGARTAAVLLEHDLFRRAADRLLVATDDGSRGCAGTVVDAYRAGNSGEPFDRVYACGPAPMLRAAAALAEDLGAPCEVSLEERMACGFGACVGCVVPVRAGGEGAFAYTRVCHDGPVFDAGTLAWEVMMQ